MNTKALSLIFGFALLTSFGTFYLSQQKNSHVTASVDDISLIQKLSLYSNVDPNQIYYRLSLFKDWTLMNNKQYSLIEFPHRFQAWNKNYEFVQDHNSKILSWTVEMNKFADLSSEEFAALYTGYNAAAYDHEKEAQNIVLLEENFEGNETVDWRNTGAVNPIRDQGQCGDCYAFASAAGLEGIFWIKNNQSAVFSPQQLCDCSGAQGNQGCNGGLMTYSYTYTKSKGIEKESDYPYKAAAGTCQYIASKAVFKNTGYSNVGATYTQLKAAVKQQPTPVAVEADQSAFQLYKSGVVSSGCGTNLDHAITAVGYVYDNSTSNAVNYWIVKNQWGLSWGNKGYIYIKMGSDNVCGINNMATYPTA